MLAECFLSKVPVPSDATVNKTEQLETRLLNVVLVPNPLSQAGRNPGHSPHTVMCVKLKGESLQIKWPKKKVVLLSGPHSCALVWLHDFMSQLLLWFLRSDFDYFGRSCRFLAEWM